METMHAAGRRTLPPVPRLAAAAVGPEPTGPAADSPATTPPAPRRPGPVAPPPAAAPATGAGPAAGDALDATPRIDSGQAFVIRLRAAGAAFADAAGAVSAVVREVVPPARHRRSRCRVVLRYADGTESDLTFVGSRRRPGASTTGELDAEITRWLVDGERRDPAWLVADEEASGGLAVDVTAWLATT